MRFETRAHYEAYDAEEEREHGPDGGLEEYSTKQGDEVALTTSEREDFECDQGVSLGSDVVDQQTFNLLVAWAKTNELLHEEG